MAGQPAGQLAFLQPEQLSDAHGGAAGTAAHAPAGLGAAGTTQCTTRSGEAATATPSRCSSLGRPLLRGAPGGGGGFRQKKEPRRAAARRWGGLDLSRVTHSLMNWICAEAGVGGAAWGG